jgi:hypothetical protein
MVRGGHRCFPYLTFLKLTVTQYDKDPAIPIL